MNVEQLRQKYLDFFLQNDHEIGTPASLVPIDVTGQLDESLLFTGAGMVQFKPYFRGTAKPRKPRVVDYQRCLRTGDIDEVGDTSHLTFFEMLGNFSFGDYFKDQAIAYSWEFMTASDWLNLDPNKLSFTVFQEDQESFDLWANHLSKAGFDPNSKIFKLGEETNYWPAGSFSKGPPGPCGPNTEMFFWVGEEAPPTGPYTADDYLRDEAAGKWLEIWNDVFISYDWQGELVQPGKPHLGYKKTGMPDLPFQSVDTGMGLERTGAVLGGFGSVYDTDVFEPIIERIEKISRGSIKYRSDSEKDRAMRIVADHARAATFCIYDGILPSNTGRGYVLRRLIRRSILTGLRTLGFKETFLPDVVEAVGQSLQAAYPELPDRMPTILKNIGAEEESFRRNLADNMVRLEDEIRGTLNQAAEGAGEHLGDQESLNKVLVTVPGFQKEDSSTWPVLSGEKVFKMYDTFGFPTEVTKEIAAESFVATDEDGLIEAMAQAQERSRSASSMDTVYGGVENAEFLGETNPETKFIGYECTSEQSKVISVAAVEGASNKAILVLSETPFYPEGGGQVADSGQISGDGWSAAVQNVERRGPAILHFVQFEKAPDSLVALVGQSANLLVDEPRRKRIIRHHTATHVLHEALRKVLGPHISQAGSLVNEFHLRFDFTHPQALSFEEVTEIERIANDEVFAAKPVTVHSDVPIDDARKMGARALFGEKYGATVRVVQIGDEPPTVEAFSRELCGGVHVLNTSELGLIKIISEASAAAGVRRILAVAGPAAYEQWLELQSITARAAEMLKAHPSGLVEAVERTLKTLKEERKKRESMAAGAAPSGTAEEHKIGDHNFIVQHMQGIEGKEVQAVADNLIANRQNDVALVISKLDGKLALAVKAGSQAVAKGAHAGNIVREVAQILGGGGGGRPDFATAGGKNLEKIDEAVARAIELASEMLS